MAVKLSKHTRGLSQMIQGTLWVHYEGRTFTIAPQATTKRRDDETNSGLLKSPMPGKVIAINVAKDDVVKRGQTLCVLEAMKMEYQLNAPIDGTVVDIYKELNAQVEFDETLVEIKGA